MSHEHVVVEPQGDVVVLRLDRPPANAFCLELARDFRAVVRDGRGRAREGAGRDRQRRLLLRRSRPEAGAFLLRGAAAEHVSGTAIASYAS